MIKKIFFVLVVALFFKVPVFAVDTLEVFILRVQFAEEKTDNTLTTGKGTFASVPDKNYGLDPVKQSGKVSYWEKHLQYANSYYQAASGGSLVIKTKVFPIYSLKKKIIDYNRTTKMDGEKTAEFDDARSRDYLTFVYDAITAAVESDTSIASPFRIPLSKNPNVKRSYMIVHAGASRLVDGGSMGTDNADTPGDFMDIYVSRDAWEYLMKDSVKSALVKPAFGTNDMGDTVVNGLILSQSVLDTLRTVMVVSETASQDGLNWGINGIIVNQIGRELGLPNTYDVVKGISRLGYFDGMDFAGYNAGNGFLPALPSAWERMYMGWSHVKEVRPTKNKPITIDIAAAGSGLGTEVVKVPLNNSEYLLIENRQRSWNKNGDVSVILASADEDTDTTMRTVTIDSLSKVFEDSTCNEKGKCSVNKKKAKGLIVGLSSYDAGLPASGIAVWKVNDWYLKETLNYGIANFWGGDTLRDHQFGISLIEADGILSIGKTFKNALGQDTYDYGSGTDLLPHKRFSGSSSSSKFEMLTSIKPSGYANTKTTQGGYTGIKIEVNVPKDSRKEKTANAFMGDSVINYVSPIMSVTISIDDGGIEGGKFPRDVGLNTAVSGVVFVDNPENENEKIMVVGSENGTIQAFTALGDTIFESDTVVRVPKISLKNSKQDVSLYRIDANTKMYGPLIGLASNTKSVFSLHDKGLLKTSFLKGKRPFVQDVSTFKKGTKKVKMQAGPIIENDFVWYVSLEDSKSYLRGLSIEGNDDFLVELPKNFIPQDMVLCKGTYGFQVVMVSVNNQILIPKPYPFNTIEDAIIYNIPSEKSENFKLACTDIDRDGINDVIVLGDLGTYTTFPIVKNKNVKETSKVLSYNRQFLNLNKLKGESSGIAIGDINGDNYPEVVFLGNNLVYALDKSGLPIAGFPIQINRGNPVSGFLSNPIIVDVNGDDIPEILVPSSDGLVYAYTGKGKQVKGEFPLAAGSFEYQDTLGTIYPMSIFVTDAVLGDKSIGPELYAFHRHSMNAFRLYRAKEGAEVAKTSWSLPAAGNERTGFFDVTFLDDVSKNTEKDEIADFFVYPNPIRGGNAKARFEILAQAKSVKLEFYDITGLCVYKTEMKNVSLGKNEFSNLDLRTLGSDVYSVRLKVEFIDGKIKQKLYRVGVIR